MSVVFDSDIKELIEEERYTYLHCTYIASEKYISDWYLNIDENCYLIGGKSLLKLKLFNVNGIPLAPKIIT